MNAPAPRRVALVIGQLTRGGAEGQLVQVASRLDRQRFEPFVYCLSSRTEPYGESLRRAGVPLRVIAGSVIGRLTALNRWLDRDGVVLIHSWLFLANAAAGLAHVRHPSRRLITSARNRKIQGRVNQLANILAFRTSQAIVVNSVDVKSYIERHYLAPSQRIRVIPNGIDTDRFRPALERRGVPRIVTAGRLVEQKNHRLFLDAVADLRRELPQLDAVIAGNGPLRQALEGYAYELGIAEQVRFTGEIDGLESVLAGASLFWLTSLWEGMPNVVLEAMACGVPVLATDVGGARELIRNGVDGFVLESGDRRGFVARSYELLSDASKHQSFSRAARQHSESFSMMHMIGAMQRMYDEALQ